MLTLTNPEISDIQCAADAIAMGRLIAFPTETVYGLGGDADNADALAKIFSTKGRPTDHPLIVHIAGHDVLDRFSLRNDEVVQKLCQLFWPGPLTLILPKRAQVLNAVTGGQSTVGLRCPAHPIALDLLRTFKNGLGGIAAPSANRFGHISPSCAQHVITEFGLENTAIMYLLDGGACEVGVESTILDLSSSTPLILRPGSVTKNALETVLNCTIADKALANSPRVSGNLRQHYAPHTPCFMLPKNELLPHYQQCSAKGLRMGVLRIDADNASNEEFNLKTVVIDLADNELAYARGLYAALHALDNGGLDQILIEQPPQNWMAINDRLKRACATLKS